MKLGRSFVLGSFFCGLLIACLGNAAAADLGTARPESVGMIQYRGEGMPDVRALSRSLTYQAIVDEK